MSELTDRELAVRDAFLTACDENPDGDGASAEITWRVMNRLGTSRPTDNTRVIAHEMADMGAKLQRPVREVWPVGIGPRR